MSISTGAMGASDADVPNAGGRRSGGVSPLRKVGVLCAKDFTDMLKNPTMLVMCAFPVAFVLLYRYMMGRALGGVFAEGAAEAGTFLATFLLSTALSMTVGMVTCTTVIYGLSEEKEKHTLRTLMLANVSAGQILLSRLILSLVATVVVAAVCFVLIPGAPMGLCTPYLVVCVLGGVPVALLSMVAGLAARDQMTASLYGVPLMLVCLLPMMTSFDEGLSVVARFAPTGGAAKLLELAMADRLFTADALLPLGVTLAWIAVGVAVFAALYKRLLRDN